MNPQTKLVPKTQGEECQTMGLKSKVTLTALQDEEGQLTKIETWIQGLSENSILSQWRSEVKSWSVSLVLSFYKSLVKHKGVN